MTFDYRELLKKYMAHVLHEEGVTFVDTINDTPWVEPVRTMSDGEVAELRKIRDELPRS